MINGRELQGQMKQIAFFALTMAYSLMVLQRELPSGRFSQNNKYSGGLFFLVVLFLVVQHRKTRVW